MIRIIRTSTLAALRSDQDNASRQPPAPQTNDCPATDALIRAETAVETLRQELADARAATARTEGERDALRAQHLLDTEDRAVLRMLLRTTRKQTRPTDRVHVLFRHGALCSIHASHDAAEMAAEAHGAPRSGWTAAEPGAPLPAAAEVPWRIQALPLG